MFTYILLILEGKIEPWSTLLCYNTNFVPPFSVCNIEQREDEATIVILLLLPVCAANAMQQAEGFVL